MYPRRRFWQWTLATLALSLAGPVRAQDEGPIQVTNVWVGFAQQPAQGQFKIGSWTPVWVDLKAGPARFSGVLELVVGDNDGTPTVFRRNIDVPAGLTSSVASYARPGSRSTDLVVRVYRRDSSGGLHQEISYTPDPQPSWIDPSQIVLVTMGHPRGVDEMVKLPGFNARQNAQDSLIVVAAPRIPGGVPGRGYGYDSAEAVIIDTNDRAVMDMLKVQGGGLERWVRGGGHLIVAVGSNWQEVGGSVLAPMLPALPKGRTRLNDLGALESFAGSGNNPIAAPLQVTQVDLVEARGGRQLDSNAGPPLVVRGHYGFGRVTVVALDVDQKPFADWADKAEFWVKAIDLKRRDDPSGGNVGYVTSGGRFIRSDLRDLSSLLQNSMVKFPGVRLVPFGWVAFFVFLYILLIGPGDYLFLKKVVKRMELTWVTFPAIVLTVSLLAYLAAYAVKGTELRINKVDAVDVDPNGLVRGMTAFILFSPQNRDYDLRIEPLAPGSKPTSESGPPASSPAGSEILLSWFGIPEEVLGGMNNSGGVKLTNTPYEYEPTGEAQTLKGVRVAIWTTKSFAGRWFGSARSPVQSDLESIGGDRLGGSLTNLLEQPLRDARLFHGGQIYELGTIAPGQSRALGSLNDRTVPLASYIKDLKDQLGNRGEGPADEQPEIRSKLIRAMMFNDSAAAPSPIGNTTFRHLDLSGQLALGRPMLVAEVEGPAAALGLGPTSGAPRTVQTTLLRVILPPPKAPAEVR